MTPNTRNSGNHIEETLAMQAGFVASTLAGVTIHSRIKEARELKGLNQSDVARHMKVSPQTVQQWENGKTAPKRDRLLALASFLGVNPEWLLFGRGTNQPARSFSVIQGKKNGQENPDVRIQAYRLVDRAAFEEKIVLPPEAKERIVNVVVGLLEGKTEIGTVKALLRAVK